MDAARRPTYTDHRGVERGFIDEDTAALCECAHKWLGLGLATGFIACSRCGQAGYMLVEFEYLTWCKEALEGHV